MEFNLRSAINIALGFTNDEGDEAGLADAFAQICNYIYDYPESLSWRSKKNKPSVLNEEGLRQLASIYFNAYRRSDFPMTPLTKPDPAVSIVMIEAFDHTHDDIDRIKREHQQAMSAENCVGSLLERYIDSVLRPYRWFWCCGSLIKAVDFISLDEEDQWLALQIKNRDNSENSSSSAIREGTLIQKWFRTYSRTGQTNWHNLPPLMRAYNLNEEGFTRFIRNYLGREKQKRMHAAQ